MSTIYLFDRKPFTYMSQRIKHLLNHEHTVEIVDWNDFNISVNPFNIFIKGNKVSTHPDVVITFSKVYTRNTYSDIDMISSVLKILEQHKILCLNPVSSTMRTINKLSSINLLKNSSIPVPETGIVSKSSDLAYYLDLWGDVVIKPVYGHGSLDVHKITKKIIWPDAVTPVNPFEEILLWDLLQKHGLMIAQQFINKIGREFRIQVIDGKAVTAFEKVGTEHRWKAVTYTQEASTSPFVFSRELASIAEEAIKKSNLYWGCVDMIMSKEGPVVLEVNPSFNFWKGYENNAYTIRNENFENKIVEYINYITENKGLRNI